MLIELFEKLINEHGSSAITKDHLNMIREKLAIVEKEKTAAETNCIALKAEAQALQLIINNQQEQILNLQSQLSKFHNSNPNKYCCDNCGSRNLTRTGNRDDPAFGVLGVKQSVFTGSECNAESAFKP